MKIGVHVVRFENPEGSAGIAPMLADVGRACDEAGLDHLSVMDHWFQMVPIGGPDKPMLEGYTTLGYLAAFATKPELHLLVTGVTYRHPGLLAKIVTTLDVLSGGRAVLGIGAAWYEQEHRGLGVPFPPVAERFERLEETLQIVKQMWSDDSGPFDGKHYQLARTLNNPQSLTRPHPPILIGGGGEKKTLRLVAKYADACNLFSSAQSGPENVVHKFAVLAEHCEREGTDYDRIRKTILWTGSLDPARDGSEFVERMAAFKQVGIEEVHVMSDRDSAGYVRALAEEIVPAVHAL